MAKTACWRKQDGELVEKVVDGLEVPEGWFDNPRLEPNTTAAPALVEVITTVVAEQVSQPGGIPSGPDEGSAKKPPPEGETKAGE